MARPALSSTLRSASIFAALTELELQLLAARSGSQAYQAGELLFNEGDPCRGLFIVATGRVRIFKSSANGREQVLSVEGPGQSFAELPVFDGGPYPASAAAMEASEVIFLSRQDFRAFCLENPEVALKVLQVVGRRLRKLVGIIEELSFTTVRHRLISWILRKAKEQGGSSVTLEGSQQELAAEIGTVRELISRNLARLQSQGYISVDGRTIMVLNAAGLEEELSTAI